MALLTKLTSAHWVDANPWMSRLLWGATIFLPTTAQWLIVYRRRPFFYAVTGLVAALLVAMTWYAAHVTLPDRDSSAIDSWLSVTGFLAWLAIMSLAEFAATTERRIADYPILFALTARNVLLPIGCWLFTLLVWGLMAIWSALFKLLGFAALAKLIQNDWLLLPLFGVAFALGTAVLIGKPTLIEGARRAISAIGAALSPLAALIIVAFVAGVAVAGLQPVWKTGYATYLILLLAALFTLFLNAAHDDGRNLLCLPKPLLILVRIAAGLLPVLVGFSVYSLGLRIAQYGWTVDRILGAVALGFAGLVALGYLASAARPRAALPNLARANMVALIAVPLLALAINSPLLSPLRISASDQLGRILDGRRPFEKIDWHLFAAQLGKPGHAALDKLAQADSGVGDSIRNAALQAIKMGPDAQYNLNAQIRKDARPPTDYKILPGGRPADGKLVAKIDADRLPAVSEACSKDCYVLAIDLDGDGRDEMVVLNEYGTQPVYKETKGEWSRIGSVGNLAPKPTSFTELIEKLKDGKAHAVAPAYRNIEIDGVTRQFSIN
ncbi:MAG TPA: hypothetical protein VGO34_12060 [Alphaproteobacteria bacterium]